MRLVNASYFTDLHLSQLIKTVCKNLWRRVPRNLVVHVTTIRTARTCDYFFKTDGVNGVHLEVSLLSAKRIISSLAEVEQFAVMTARPSVPHRVPGSITQEVGRIMTRALRRWRGSTTTGTRIDNIPELYFTRALAKDSKVKNLLIKRNLLTVQISTQETQYAAWQRVIDATKESLERHTKTLNRVDADLAAAGHPTKQGRTS